MVTAKTVRILLLAALIFITVGFHYPDPYYFANPNGEGLVFALKLVRGILAGFSCGWIVWEFFPLRRLKIDSAGIRVMVVSLVVSALGLISVVAIWDDLRIHVPSEYHSFLQLNPGEGVFSEGSTIRIAFLGGSTTAWGDSQGRGWPDRVREKLQSRFGSRVDVLNLAREWYSSKHTLIQYLGSVRHLKPTHLVVMHSLNDLLYNADFSYLSAGPFRSDYGHFAGVEAEALRRSGVLGNLFRKLRAGWYHKPRKEVHQSEFPGLNSFTNNLELLIRNATADGVKIILMTEPTILAPGVEDSNDFYMVHFEAVGPHEQWGIDTAIKGMIAYNDAVRVIGSKQNVNLIDLDAEIPKTKASFSDEVHFKDPTFEIAGEVVSRGLERVIAGGLAE